MHLGVTPGPALPPAVHRLVVRNARLDEADAVSGVQAEEGGRGEAGPTGSRSSALGSCGRPAASAALPRRAIIKAGRDQAAHRVVGEGRGADRLDVAGAFVGDDESPSLLSL